MCFIRLGLCKLIQEFVQGGRVLDLLIVRRERLLMFKVVGRPLLQYAHETGLDGIEAITPRPQGDVTLEEAKEALGDDMFLLDGIPAIYFDKTFPSKR